MKDTNILNLIDNTSEINLIETLMTDKKSLVFKDSTTGEVLDKEAIAIAIKDSNDESLPKKIIVEIEATHNGITKNNTEYISEKMKKSANTWTSPYNKPVLLNHDQRGPTLGRVVGYQFKTSELNPEKDTIKLTLEISDPGSIKRHLDDTALTYSIGASAKEVYCSICGIDIINSDSWCGHWKGDKYKIKKDGEDSKNTETKTCIWQIGHMEYLEVSEVNIPADVWAQKLTVKVKEEDKLKDNIEEDIIDDTFNDIDNILQQNDNTSTDQSNVNDDINLTDNNDNNGELNEIERLKEEISSLKQEALEIKLQLETTNKEKVELEEKLQKFVDQIADSTRINLNLSKLIKQVYTESIVNAKIRLEDITKENVEIESDKLKILGVKELAETFKEYIDREINCPKSIPKITQADTGMLGIYQHNVDSVPKTNSDKKIKPKSMKDAINGMLESK